MVKVSSAVSWLRATRCVLMSQHAATHIWKLCKILQEGGEQLQGPAGGQNECMHEIQSWNRDHAMSNIGTVQFHQYVQLVYFL
jgi:hypothetical protein